MRKELGLNELEMLRIGWFSINELEMFRICWYSDTSIYLLCKKFYNKFNAREYVILKFTTGYSCPDV